LGLWPRPDRLVAVRRGNPLHWGLTDQCYYLGSLAEGLPGKPQAVPDHSACLFTRREVRHAAL
jgi:hypothetical protein